MSCGPFCSDIAFLQEGKSDISMWSMCFLDSLNSLKSARTYLNCTEKSSSMSSSSQLSSHRLSLADPAEGPLPAFACPLLEESDLPFIDVLI